MTRIIDTNRHGIRREIDHQYKPKKRIKKSYPQDKKLNEVNSKELSTEDKDLSTDNTKLSTDIDISILKSGNVSRKGPK